MVIRLRLQLEFATSRISYEKKNNNFNDSPLSDCHLRYWQFCEFYL